jgi:competence protein ComFC
MLYQGYLLGWKLLDVLFPPQCAGCGEWGSRFCSRCIQKIEPIQGLVCQVCGELISEQTRLSCDRCQAERPVFSAVRSWAVYQGVVRNAILRLKYNRDLGLGETLAKLMGGLLADQSWKIDLVTVVPLDDVRLRTRGYNQSELIGKPLAFKTGLDYSSAAITRKRSTRSQVGLAYQERLKNVRDAFEAKSGIVSGKSILVIDDVVTTGATINSCAAALIKAKARNVFGLTLARAARLGSE